MKFLRKGTVCFLLFRKTNLCRFVEWEPSLFKIGDIALFYSLSGQLVGHRLCRTERIGENFYYTFKGDTNLGTDDPVLDSAIVGKLVCIKKKKFTLRMDHFYARLWGKLIQSFPFLSGLLRHYLNKRVQRN
ncbi:hypothetical protein [Bacillus sp. RAR_GA_16]|uniref:hypothetical protein n=1 Tax=Bacillus sp. RAR_GA_16 TaxID=2876774 RepID=UPI001CC9D21A|nr:hypothetical protein [Bacillus sp. RAR_GA_16]MCA0172889.1 hypothetical protein [Bacillus sp. RAR_GA_16]